MGLGDLWYKGRCGVRDDVDSGTCQWTQGCVDREAYGDLWDSGTCGLGDDVEFGRYGRVDLRTWSWGQIGRMELGICDLGDVWIRSCPERACQQYGSA